MEPIGILIEKTPDNEKIMENTEKVDAESV
jgi:hypothetical protein